MNTHKIIVNIYTESYDKTMDVDIITDKIKKEAPKITGSNGNANIFVNSFNCCNLFPHQHCLKCPHIDKVVNVVHGEIVCNHPRDFVCPEIEHKTVRVSILVHLQGRTIQQTRQEYLKFIKWVKDNLGTIIQLKLHTIM